MISVSLTSWEPPSKKDTEMTSMLPPPQRPGWKCPPNDSVCQMIKDVTRKDGIFTFLWCKGSILSAVLPCRPHPP